jgi:class 3 adenylate cyclase
VLVGPWFEDRFRTYERRGVHGPPDCRDQSIRSRSCDEPLRIAPQARRVGAAYASIGMAPTGTVTVLFTDLVGSTALMTELGNDRFQALLTEHDTLVDAAIEAHAGERVEHTGDGVMAVFAGAADGLGAAVAIQQAVERRNRRADATLTVRAALSAGDVTEKDSDYFGTAVVEAARLCAIAEGGQILAAEVVKVLAGSRGDHEFVALGELELKGLAPLATVTVQWEQVLDQARVPLPIALAEARGTLVGREAELERLLGVWARTQPGTRQIVMLGGEPGIGKTRLATELAHRAHTDGGIVLLGRCEDGFGAPYKPFAEALRDLPSVEVVKVLPTVSNQPRSDRTTRVGRPAPKRHCVPDRAVPNGLVRHGGSCANRPRDVVLMVGPR